MIVNGRLATLKRVVNGDGARCPKEGGECLPWRAHVFDSFTWRAVSGLKSAGAVVSNPGAWRKGGKRFGGFGVKPSPNPGKRKASATTSEGAEKDGLVGRQCPQAYRFRWFGPQNYHRFIWVGRGSNKIETLKVTGGHVVDIAWLRRS